MILQLIKYNIWEANTIMVWIQVMGLEHYPVLHGMGEGCYQLYIVGVFDISNSSFQSQKSLNPSSRSFDINTE